MRKIRALILVGVMFLGPLVTATSAQAYTRNPCSVYDFYSYTGYDYNVGDLYDAYDRYTVCDGGWSQYDFTWYYYY